MKTEVTHTIVGSEIDRIYAGAWSGGIELTLKDGWIVRIADLSVEQMELIAEGLTKRVQTIAQKRLEKAHELVEEDLSVENLESAMKVLEK